MSAVSVPYRAARAAVFATVCVALSAAGHAMLSPDPLPWWVPATALVVVFALATAGAGRERSFAAIAVPLVVCQAALHGLFSWAAAARLTPGPATPSAVPSIVDRLLCGSRDSAGHILMPPGWTAEDVVRGAGLDPSLLAGPATGAHTGHGGVLFHGGTGMLAAHALAGLVMAWWLRQGDAALFRVLARLDSGLARPLRALVALVLGLRPVTPGPARPARRPAVTWRVPAGALLRHEVVRRGPPRVALAR